MTWRNVRVGATWVAGAWLAVLTGCMPEDGAATTQDATESEPDAEVVPEPEPDAEPDAEVVPESETDEVVPETETETDVATEPPSKLGLDYAAEPIGAAPRYVALDAAVAAPPWLSRPWPSDRWRVLDAKGVAHLDLSVLPFPGADLFKAYLALGETLHGYGLNGAGFLAFEAALDAAQLPDPATTRADPTTPIQLLDLTAGAPTYGQRHPIDLQLNELTTSRWVEPHLLAFRPVRGMPLAPAATYCFIVARSLRDAQGHHLARAPAFAAELAGAAPDLAPLRAWLATAAAQFASIDLAAATCFTTDAPAADLWTIRAYLQTTPAPTVTEVHATTLVTVAGPHGDVQVDEYRGHYDAPNFQRGSAPYTNEGGDFVFDAAGQPIVQLNESMRFLLWVPRTPPPAAGYPVIVVSHGTGGNYESCTRSSGPGPHVTPLGIAVLCIDQPGVGERGNGTPPDWLNIANPAAARTTMRQSAIDFLSLVRALGAGHFDLPATVTPTTTVVHFDADRIAFFGHSQGALTGALALAIVPEIKGAFLSSGGGLITESALGSFEAAPYLPALGAIIDDDPANLDTFHPVMSVLQIIGDAADPINYAPSWLLPIDGFSARHVLMTSGTADTDAPIATGIALSAAAGIPLAEPVPLASPTHALLGLAPVALPATANLPTPSGPRTAAHIVVPDADHFVGLGPPYRAVYVAFLASLLAGTPTIPMP